MSEGEEGGPVRPGRLAPVLSWVVAILCAFYIVRVAYGLRDHVPVLALLFEGLGAEAPRFPKFLLVVSQVSVPVGWFLAVAVVGKERLIRDTSVRLALTLVALLCVAFLSDYATQRSFEPLIHILKQLN